MHAGEVTGTPESASPRWQWYATFFAVPVTALAVLYGLEALIHTQDVEIPLFGRLDEVQKRILDLDSDIAKSFQTYSLTVLAAIAYYIKTRSTDFTAFGRRAMAATLGVIASSVVSIAFGHFWIAALRDQLAAKYFDPTAPVLARAETVQYVAFIASIVWFAFLVFDREHARKPGETADGTATAQPPHTAS